MKLRKILLITFAFTLIAACKKYEDGPALSFRSKEERVANTWIISRAFENNADVTENYSKYEMYLTKDGDARLTARYLFFGAAFETETNGTWQFTNNKDNIRFDYEDDDFDEEYRILKLTEKEFWMRKTGSDVELQFRER